MENINAIQIREDSGEPAVNWKVPDDMEEFGEYLKRNVEKDTEFTVTFKEYTPEEWKEIEAFEF